MTDESDAPKPRKSFLRRVFSQAEPAPSKTKAIDPNWHPQSEAVDALASVGPAETTSVVDVQPRPTSEAAPGETLILPAEGPVVEPAIPAPLTPAHAPIERPLPIDGDASFLAREPHEPLETPADTAPVARVPPDTIAIPTAAPKRSWWTRLKDGLARSSSSIGAGIGDIFTKRKLDSAMLEELEDVLIRADLGVATATRISEAVGKGRYDRAVSPDEVKAILATEVERVLAPHATPLAIGTQRPFVVLVVGVNGSGKTTTIGKLAAKFTGEGKRVTLAAGDTFRAAAIAQLKIWGDRLGCPVIASRAGLGRRRPRLRGRSRPRGKPARTSSSWTPPGAYRTAPN